MERVLNALLFSIVSMAALGAIGAQEQPAAKPPGEASELLRCIYTPQADHQSSSLPTSKIGFKFSLQRNNGNHIAADTYTLNDSNQLVKQIGHAELVSSVAEVTATTKATDLVSGLTLAEDSPFEFQIIADSAAADANGRFNAIVTSMTTFTGAAYSQVAVSCRLPLAPQQQPQQASAQKTRLN